jgi:hypothetical protein
MCSYFFVLRSDFFVSVRLGKLYASCRADSEVFRAFAWKSGGDGLAKEDCFSENQSLSDCTVGVQPLGCRMQAKA